MKNVIQSKDRQEALNDALRFLQYFPYRFAAIVEHEGVWGYMTGNTKAKFNNLARLQGVNVYMVQK